MTATRHLFGLLSIVLLVRSCQSQYVLDTVGYCPYGETPLVNSMNEPVPCSTTTSYAQCPQGYTCTADVAGMYCCQTGGFASQYGLNSPVQTAGYGANSYGYGYGPTSYQQTSYGNTGYGTGYGTGYNPNAGYGTGYSSTGYGTGYGTTGYGTGYGTTGYGTGYGTSGYAGYGYDDPYAGTYGYGTSGYGYGSQKYCPSGSIPYFAPGSSYPTSCTIGISTCPYSNTCQSCNNAGYGARGYCCSTGFGGSTYGNSYGSTYGKKKK